MSVVASLCTWIATATPYCDIRKFSILDGLAANTISDLQQGKDNLMWFGTWNGLSYYDGYTFRTVRDDPDDMDVLGTNRILFVRPSVNENVWCVTFDHKPYVYDTHQCQFLNIGKDFSAKFHIDLRVKDIFPLSTGTTYLTDIKGNYIVRVTNTPLDDNNPQLIRVGKHGLRSGRVWYIHTDKQRREWILTQKGATIYNSHFSTPIPFKWIREVRKMVFLATQDGRLAVYDEQNNLSMIPLPKGVTRINELKNTGYQLLIATNLGVVIYNPRNFKTDLINVQSPNQPVAEVERIYVDRTNQVWAFTKGQGVTLINPKTGSTQWLYADAPTPEQRTVSDQNFIMEDEHNTLWVIPNQGSFSYFNRKTGQLIPYELKSNSAGNYRIPRISKYVISDQGILWITGVHELTQINFKNHTYTLDCLDEGESEVRAISTTPDGTNWTGFYNGCVKVSKDHKKLGYLTPGGQLSPNQTSFSPRGIYALYADGRKHMWIGTDGDGLYILSQGKLQHYKHIPSDKNSLPSDTIYDIVADKRGHIWIATYGGGLVYAQEKEDGFHFFSKNNGLNWPKGEFLKVRRITCTTAGEILVGTTDGLVTFSDETRNFAKTHFYTTRHIDNDTLSLTASDVNFTLVRSDGTAYLSSLGGTMQQIRGKNLLRDNLKLDYFKLLNLDEGIVQSMIEDNKGNLWIVRESSIDKVDLHTGMIDIFGPNDFDFNMTFTEARPIHDPSTNNITVGTPMGSLTFNPSLLRKTTYQPKIIFTALYYNGETTYHPILHREKIVIPANKRNMTISFAALDYTRKYQTHYAYRLEGQTPKGKWISLRGQNLIAFNNISPGTYVLKVKATNTHGVWSNYISELPIEVQPTFWESIWGKGILFFLVIAIIGFLFYLYNVRQHQIIAHNLSLMKNKFFTDASHKLRTPLSLIGGPITEILNNDTSLSDKSRKLLDMTRQNASEMLEMINEMLKYDNSDNFYINEGDGHVFANKFDGEVDDANAHTHMVAQENSQEREPAEEKGKKNITILVVEDNADLRTFLKAILESDYNIIMAVNGREGLIKARHEMPDFILTDVTMPVMDGITMIHQIKQDSNIAHIPIIILSAKASVEDHLKGYEEGIDGYLTKPFSATYLKGRIEALINQRHTFPQTDKKIAADQEARQPTNIADSNIQGINDETIERIVQFINLHIADADLKIDDIATAMGMSRSVLYGKIKSAVGMTPVDLVRHIRIMRGADLLIQTNDNLANIAYSVGFSDPKYFSKVFKKEMGIIPSEYRERAK